MHEDVRHLLRGVVDEHCVEPTMNPLITGAPLAVSAIAKQCLYTCYTVSSSHAVLNDKSSPFWRVLRYVEYVREKYVESETLPLPPPLKLQHNYLCEATGGDDTTVLGDGGMGGVVLRVNTSSSDPATSCDRSLPYSPLLPSKMEGTQKVLLSPLEFCVVVVGGGRVGRAVVDSLIRVRELIHPSRVTIITQRPEAVACFAAQGVQCVAKDAGRQALMQCHVLVIACQQSHFHDFAKLYCPRSSLSSAAVGNVDGEVVCGNTSDAVESGRNAERNRRRPQKRTLRDVVDKWRTVETDEHGGAQKHQKASPRGSSRRHNPVTRLLKPDAVVFSCSVALPTHKVACDLGHLYPLVVRARVNLRSVRAVAEELQTARAALHDDYVKRLQSEGNTFLTRLTLLQESATTTNKQKGLMQIARTNRDKRTEVPSPALSGALCNTMGSLPCLSAGDSFAKMDLDQHPQLQQRREGGVADVRNLVPHANHDENPTFVVHMWRALRSFSVVQALNFTKTDQRSFTYLDSIGPLLGGVLVGLPSSTQNAVISSIETHVDNSFRYYQSRVTAEHVPGCDVPPRTLLKLNLRHVSAFDSDDDEEVDGEDDSQPMEYSLSPAQPFFERELRRLVRHFPTVFKNSTSVLQQLLSVYRTVTHPPQ